MVHPYKEVDAVCICMLETFTSRVTSTNSFIFPSRAGMEPMTISCTCVPHRYHCKGSLEKPGPVWADVTASAHVHISNM